MLASRRTRNDIEAYLVRIISGMHVEQPFNPYVFVVLCSLVPLAHLRSTTVGPLAAQAFDVDQAFWQPSTKLFCAVTS